MGYLLIVGEINEWFPI